MNRQTERIRIHLAVMAVAMCLLSGALLAQAPFLSYKHDDAGVSQASDWVFPETIDLCLTVEGAPVLVPVGGPQSGWEIDAGLAVTTGHVVLQNDSNDLDADPVDGVPDTPVGLCVLSMRPTTVGLKFPPRPRNYRMKARFFLEVEDDGDPATLDHTNELIVFVRTIIGVNDVSFDTHHERIYVSTFIPQGVLEREADFSQFPELFDGAVALLEFGSCHGLVDHPEWPNARPDLGANWATGIPDTPILAGEWNWAEVTVQGDDDGGPVLIEVRTWPDGTARPATALIRAWDLNGFVHTTETRDPANAIEIGFGTSWHLRDDDAHMREQFAKRTRIDDITLTTLPGCAKAPVTVTRALWGTPVLVEGQYASPFDTGTQYTVSLGLTNRRQADASCAVATNATIYERVPAGWPVSNISNGGTFDAPTNTITWSSIALGGTVPTLTYKVTPPSGVLARERFSGELTEPGSEYYFFVKGDSMAVLSSAIESVSDLGAILHWLILGPYEQCGGAAPGDELMRRDYLTDGTISEADIQPVAGDAINTNYRTLAEGEMCTDPQEPGEAASLSLLADEFGRNPGGIATWMEWRGLDDDDERTLFEDVYGDLSNMMEYALTYIDVTEATTVNLGVSSDDGVQVLLDGAEIHLNNTARGSQVFGYQDTPFTHPGLGNIELSRGPHTLVVKTFEGGGDHNFRLGFLDAGGFELPFGPEGVAIQFTPPPNRFVRGDCNGDGDDNISDAIFSLLYQFSGGHTPSCLESCDVNRDGALNITDAVYLLDFLFKGGPPAPAPYPACDSALQSDCGRTTCG